MNEQRFLGAVPGRPAFASLLVVGLLAGCASVAPPGAPPPAVTTTAPSTLEFHLDGCLAIEAYTMIAIERVPPLPPGFEPDGPPGFAGAQVLTVDCPDGSGERSDALHVEAIQVKAPPDIAADWNFVTFMAADQAPALQASLDKAGFSSQRAEIRCVSKPAAVVCAVRSDVQSRDLEGTLAPSLRPSERATSRFFALSNGTLGGWFDVGLSVGATELQAIKMRASGDGFFGRSDDVAWGLVSTERDYSVRFSFPKPKT
jgi:hypothetical protein